ncbi:MAG TPA: CoA-binding protein [Candidatus Eisenbacteria bacterium]|nr:CoA-binding protein [Candidatus Eisenbacteria bacterium]
MDPASYAPSDAVLRELLIGHPVIALVGASSRPERASHRVMRGLLALGYTVVPVNPNEREVLGLPCYPDLHAVPRRIDLVDVFRRSEATPPIARAAAEVGARVLWLQLGVVSGEAATIALDAGLIVVMDRCTMIEHDRLIGGPLPPVSAEQEGAADPVGLCRDCRHARIVPAGANTYWLCGRSASDPSFPRYPRLPIRACRGFAWKEASAKH